MGRFDFQSPGAAFTSQIADALAQRKVQERQHMLDQLTMNADARAAEDQEFQRQHLARQEAESKARMGQMAQESELTKLSALEAPMDADTDPASLGYKP